MRSMAKKPAKAEVDDRGTTSVTVRLDNELVAWLDSRAEQENRSRANLIETLLKRAQKEPGYPRVGSHGVGNRLDEI